MAAHGNPRNSAAPNKRTLQLQSAAKRNNISSCFPRLTKLTTRFRMSTCANTSFKNVTHCIFDMDGLLLDSENLSTQATQQILDKYGKTYTWEVKATVMGLHRRAVAEHLVATYDLPMSWQEYCKQHFAITSKLMADVQMLPGVERLVRHLVKHNVPIAVATSSGEDMVQIKISKHEEVFQLFHHRVCGSTDVEVNEGKPAPDIFLMAALRFEDKPEPAQCLVFEDAPNGVRAAVSAGMQIVLIPDKHVPAEMYGSPTKVLKSMEDFKPEQFGLPAFEPLAY